MRWLATLDNWRGLVVIVTIFLALTSVNLTGNYFRIRRFLLAHLVATFAGELFLASGGDTASTTYFWLYLATSLPILISALLISARMVEKAPDELKVHYIAVPIIMAVVAFYLTPFALTRIGVFMALQGCILMVAGVQARAAAELESPVLNLPHKTLGMMWILQSILFFLYASGVPIHPIGWEQIGNWLPALIVSGAMLKLAWDFQKAARYETSSVA